MKKNLNRQNGTSGSDAKGSSRVSGAADVTPTRIQSTRVEQRSSLPSNKRGSSSSASKGSGRGKQAAGSSTRKKPSGSRSSYSPPQDNTSDSQFIRTAMDQWNGMEAHQRQRIFSVLLLLLSLLLFGSLTLFRHTPVLKSLSDFFLTFFGWGAYLLALGLVAFSVAHLIEGIQKRVFVSWRLVFGLSCIWLILLTESRLIMGHMSVGILAELLVAPLLGWGAAVGHLLLFGLLVIFVIFTFRITLGQMIAVSQQIFHAIMHDPRQADTAEPEEDISEFIGQRPQYSRYGATPLPPALPEEQANTPATKRGAAKPPAPRRRPQLEALELEDDENENIEFEADFDDDDPENDINVLKSKVGFVPKGPRAPIDTRVEAVKGAKQSPLPFQPAQEEDGADEQQEPLILSQNNARNRGKMEDLQPNPSKIPVSVQPRTRAAQAPAPIPESPWKLPDTSLLNNPEEVKQHMLGDDTAALARTIQETLRSFRVDAEVRAEDISIGPTVIRFGIRPTGKPEMTVDDKGRPIPVRDAQGNIIYETRTRVSRIMALQNDLALVLEAKTIRMEAPVPGRPYVGVEIPNKNSRLVTLREVLESKEYQIAKSKSKLAIALGKDVAGQVRVGDLARMPHLLIAGATGAGKCLAFDEPVFLADGRIIKVQELLGKSEQVIGVTDTQTMSQVPVLATFTDNGVQDVFEIELDNGVIIRRTGEHPLWAASLDENQHVGHQSNGKAIRRTRAIDAGWVQTKDLRVCGNRPHFAGHVILCPLSLQQQGTVAHSDADVILCAALLAEGSLNLQKRRTPRITSADAPIVAMVAEAVKAYDCKLVLSKNKSKGPIDYYISKSVDRNRCVENPVARLVRNWNMVGLATQKTMPSWVFQLPDEQIALFLRVFIDCDGWFCARSEGTVSVNVTLANPTLVRQIGQLALRLGITGTYTYKENAHAGAWTWSSSMVDVWQERIGSTVKTEKLACAVKNLEKNRENAASEWKLWRRARTVLGQKFSDCPQGYEWHKIADIRRIVVPTVNIEVHSENHAFVGYAVEHNSVAINIIIASIITHAVPDDVRMLMVDPKMVELSMYNGIPHLLAPVVIEVDKVVSLLRNAINEMERRYRLFSQLGVRNLDGYRKLRAEKLAKGDESLSNMPAIVIIIDELADLMMAAPEEVEGMICRLAQLARATGIHLVIATQRPSVDVITGLIKANIPTRISFMVSSAVDSRTIIDMGGAERLLGRGDMLYLPADAGRPERIQCSFLTDDEAETLVAFWREQVAQHALQAHQAKSQGQGDPALAPTQPQIEPGWEITQQHSDEFELDDDLLEQAEEIVREFGKASISLLQRRLRIGYSRAARLIDLLEERGIIGHAESGGRGREVFEGGGGGNDRFGEGHSIADEVADITAEERARDEFLKKQQASLHNNQSPPKDNQ